MEERKLSHDAKFPPLALAIAIVIGFLAILPYFGLRFEYTAGDLVDNRLSNYLIEHGYKWITGQTDASFFDAPFFYPARATIRYSENFLGSLPFYAPWRLLGFDRESSFQIWIVLGYFLNYLAAAWVLNKLRFHWFAVLSGAYVFAFSQVVLTHSWHIQLQYRFAVPLAWYFLYLFLEEFRPKHLLVCLSFVAWQFYCNIYEGYFLGLFLAAFVLVSVCSKPIIRTYLSNATRQSVIAQFAIVLGFTVAVGALGTKYQLSVNDRQLMEARRQEAITMLPRPVSYFLAHTGSPEAGWLFERVDLPVKHEHVMFVGLIPWAAVLVLLVTARKTRKHPYVMPAILAMLLIIVGTLYVNGYSLYFALMKLPAISGMRGVTRIIMILVWPFALATAQVLHLCWERLQTAGIASPMMTAFFIVVAAALFLENRTTPYRHSKEEGRERVRKLAEQLPTPLPNHAVLAYAYPIGGDPLEGQMYELDAMLTAQSKNIRTQNGYSSAGPDGYRPLHSCSDIRVELDDFIRRNDSFPVQDAASQIVPLGSPPDAPCGAILTREASSSVEPLQSAAFRAKLDIQAPPAVRLNSDFVARLNVTNESDLLWRVRGFPSGKFALRTSCQWLTAGSQVLSDYPVRFEFPYDLRPHESVMIPAFLTAPAEPGMYTIECDAVQELFSWFRSKGSRTGKTVIEVQRDRVTSAIQGTLDLVTVERVEGWAWNPERPETSVQVEIRDADNRLATVAADRFRKDLLDAGIGSGAHGFSIPNPLQRRDGRRHDIHAVVAGTNIELGGSPKSFTAPQ